MENRLCILLKSLPTGGVEKMMLNLVTGIVERGYSVDIAVFEGIGMLMDSVPESVNLIALTEGGTKRGSRRLLDVAKKFSKYLRERSPDIVISAKEQANLINVLFRLIYRNGYRSVITRHVPLDESLVGSDAKPYVRWLYRLLLWKADYIVAVSEGIAGEIRSLIPKSAGSKVGVICNPVVDGTLFKKAEMSVDEPWFEDRNSPVIVASGRLSFQKGFDILLEAVSIIRNDMPVKLLILGEGDMRDRLIRKIGRLGLDGHVKLTGYKENPYPYYRNADVYVLSSRWEGQPLALIEALALGTRVVATDCRTGPADILQGGALGVLVPPEDPVALANGIVAALRGAGNQERAGAQDIDKYSVRASSGKYDELFCDLLRGLQ